MFKSFRRFLGLGLLGVMFITAAIPTVASAQKKGSKKSGKGGKGSQKKGGGRGVSN